jgi:hypothetical protein
MNVAELRTDLHDKIDHADSSQIKEIYGLLINYFNGQYSPEKEWESLPEYQQNRILKSLKQADAGLGKPAEDVIKNARSKYGLNG